jgi:hypothetical protein
MVFPSIDEDGWIDSWFVELETIYSVCRIISTGDLWKLVAARRPPPFG